MSQPPARDSGFTLIEVLVVISLLGTMMAIAISGWSSWAKSSAHRGTAQEIQTVLRQAHQRAVSEGQAVCVDFDVVTDRYSVYAAACSDAESDDMITGPLETNAAGIYLEDPSFEPAETGVTFHARGTASPGTVEVRRVGSSKSYTLSVEELTGRVSLN